MGLRFSSSSDLFGKKLFPNAGNYFMLSIFLLFFISPLFSFTNGLPLIKNYDAQLSTNTLLTPRHYFTQKTFEDNSSVMKSLYQGSELILNSENADKFYFDLKKQPNDASLAFGFATFGFLDEYQEGINTMASQNYKKSFSVKSDNDVMSFKNYRGFKFRKPGPASGNLSFDISIK